MMQGGPGLLVSPPHFLGPFWGGGAFFNPSDRPYIRKRIRRSTKEMTGDGLMVAPCVPGNGFWVNHKKKKDLHCYHTNRGHPDKLKFRGKFSRVSKALDTSWTSPVISGRTDQEECVAISLS